MYSPFRKSGNGDHFIYLLYLMTSVERRPSRFFIGVDLEKLVRIIPEQGDKHWE